MAKRSVPALGGLTPGFWLIGVCAALPAFAAAPSATPQRERDLVAIAMDARKQYMTGHSASPAQDARIAMQIRVIGFMRQSLLAEDWTGIVKSHGTTPQGSAWISIEIADGITVSTWQNEDDDFNAATLFKPHSPLFQFTESATIGQPVVFSATFQKAVLSSDEQMVTQPQFIARFTSLKAAQQTP
jgi:hypothetical protein